MEYTNLLQEVINELGTQSSAYKSIFEIDRKLIQIRYQLSNQELVKQIDEIRLKLSPTFRMVEL